MFFHILQLFCYFVFLKRNNIVLKTVFYNNYIFRNHFIVLEDNNTVNEICIRF